MDCPKPVPPYLRVKEPSARTKGWKSLLTVWRDTNTGISDSEAQHYFVFVGVIQSHIDSNFALLGKLDCVVDQIGEHLAQAGVVAFDAARHIAGDAGCELQFLVRSLVAQRAGHRVHCLSRNAVHLAIGENLGAPPSRRFLG
jgi:hypothetical protein